MKRDKKWLILLILLVLATRLPYLLTKAVPFSFDHGRDSMAVLHMIKTYSLKFIGPWTSIPGLFFGPGWYYLLSPAYIITNGHPMSGVMLMLILGLIQIWLAYKYLGKEEAIIMATAPIWIILSTGAANPFPMTLVSLLILILLKQIEKKRKISLKQIIALGFLTSLGFHFSSATSIFYLLIIPAILFLRKIKLGVKKIGAGIGAFIIPFIPQLLFEIKNNFLQVKSVAAYFIEGESQHISRGKISTVNQSVFHELSLAVLPRIGLFSYFAIGLLIVGLIYILIKKKLWPFWLEIGILTMVPVIGFWFLHYSVHYSYGLLPIAVVVVGYLLRSAPKLITILYLILLLVSPFYGLYQHYTDTYKVIENSRAFLPIKIKVLEYIYQEAGNKPFSSYQYLPNIYDYDYQYLYFWQAFNGKPLPVEFSYKPGEISYVTEKPDLLKKFPKNNEKAEKVFLIINKPENVHHYPLDQWLGNIKYKKIVSKKVFSEEVEVWEIVLDV